MFLRECSYAFFFEILSLILKATNFKNGKNYNMHHGIQQLKTIIPSSIFLIHYLCPTIKLRGHIIQQQIKGSSIFSFAIS